MYIILHNPLTKNKKSRRTIRRVVNHFKRRGIPFRLKSLLKIENIEHYIKHSPEDTKFLLLGGDGTINTFINQTYNLHMLQEIFLMGVGSGNDFLRSLRKQAPKHQTIMRSFFDNKSRFFINGSGMGMDGAIAHRVNKMKRTNRLNYFISALRTFAKFKPKYMEVEIDGTMHTFNKAYLINANAGEFIGGGMRLTPEANLENDYLEILVVHSIPRFLIFLIFLSVYFGVHSRLRKYVFIARGKHVKATMFSPQISQCDGETYEKVKTLEAYATKKRVAFKPFNLHKTK